MDYRCSTNLNIYVYIIISVRREIKMVICHGIEDGKPCLQDNANNSKFCPNCGTKLGEPQQQSSLTTESKCINCDYDYYVNLIQMRSVISHCYSVIVPCHISFHLVTSHIFVNLALANPITGGQILPKIGVHLVHAQPLIKC